MDFLYRTDMNSMDYHLLEMLTAQQQAEFYSQCTDTTYSLFWKSYNHFISCLILLSWENLNICLFRASFQYKSFWQPKSILRRRKKQNMAVVLTHSPLKPWVCSSHTISCLGLKRGGNPKARNSEPWLYGWLVMWP